MLKTTNKRIKYDLKLNLLIKLLNILKFLFNFIKKSNY